MLWLFYIYKKKPLTPKWPDPKTTICWLSSFLPPNFLVLLLLRSFYHLLLLLLFNIHIVSTDRHVCEYVKCIGNESDWHSLLLCTFFPQQTSGFHLNLMWHVGIESVLKVEFIKNYKIWLIAGVYETRVKLGFL